MTICLKEFGVVCALGNDKQQVLRQQPLDDRILHQQQLYTDAYTSMLEQQSDASLQSYTSKEQQYHHSKLVAASWGALSAATTVR